MKALRRKILSLYTSIYIYMCINIFKKKQIIDKNIALHVYHMNYILQRAKICNIILPSIFLICSLINYSSVMKSMGEIIVSS